MQATADRCSRIDAVSIQLEGADHASTSSPRFSQDINGLRAMAVLVVMLFHFGVPGLRGGFVGVDIFFVISGCLMTGIIVRRLEAGRFSLVDFYVERARRIVPALLVLCVVLFAVGWLVLLPSEFRRMGKQIASSAVFASNLLFWRQSGYFDEGSHEKWLLHTWSLAVEWQFYLLYPLLLVALRRMVGAARTGFALAIVAVLAFALAVVGAERWPTSAFYLLPFRAWEMFAGGLVALIPFPPGRIGRRWVQVSGLVLLAIGFALIGVETPWPGGLALLPVTGTALVIWSAWERSALLGHPVAQFLGTISYSVYLWHWPVEVALRRFESGILATPTAHIATGLVLSLSIASLSYRWVERPARRLGQSGAAKRGGLLRRDVLQFGAASLAIALLGAGVWKLQGAPWRFSDTVQIADREATDGDPYGPRCFSTFGPALPPCRIGFDGPARVLLIGDSHALAIATALAAAAPAGGRSAGGVQFQGYASCPTVQGVTYGAHSELKCFDFNRTYLDPLTEGTESPVPLVVTNYWSSYLDASGLKFAGRDASGADPQPFNIDGYRQRFEATMCALARRRPVYVTLPFPEFAEHVPRTMALRLMRDPHAPDMTLPVGDYRQHNAQVIGWMQAASARCGIHLLDPVPYLCPDGLCRGSLNGRPLYTDRHHLSEFGNRLLVPMFRQVFVGGAEEPRASPSAW
ncbi:O-antigen acetylase [Methylibium petroleiphilum PM1]|uniref:O-antigen acetylase n=1 Tax=Methylibium petroleiphilum (strain ATCC BAA-1232 / LMG 22953 / PM1) TaxID=420662 RepID=A2SJH3_METPP|nr:O-antigen acetylase [Methylibium petroleiphilum PM1]